MKSLVRYHSGPRIRVLADAVTRYRLAVPVAADISLAGCASFTRSRNLKFDPSRDNLVGSGKSYHSNYMRSKRSSIRRTNLAVVVESENPEKKPAVHRAVGRRGIRKRTIWFTGVFYRNDFKMLGQESALVCGDERFDGAPAKADRLPPFITTIHPNNESRFVCS